MFLVSEISWKEHSGEIRDFSESKHDQNINFCQRYTERFIRRTEEVGRLLLPIWAAFLKKRSKTQGNLKRFTFYATFHPGDGSLLLGEEGRREPR
jgi:hypothetical protein